jgi:hypothetical protein
MGVAGVGRPLKQTGSVTVSPADQGGSGNGRKIIAGV